MSYESQNLKQTYQYKKVLVTGGTGLIGRQVVPLLCDWEADVTIVSLDDLEVDKRARHLYCDLRYYNDCLRVTKGYDFVFHLAGIKANPNITNKKPATMSIPALQVNTNVLEACKEHKIKKVLFTSSIGAYAQSDILMEVNAYHGEPMDFLPGHVKRLAEYQIQAYAKEFKLDWVVVRLSNTYGPGDNFDPDNGMFISALMAQIYRGDNPVKIWGNGTAIRDFTYSKDIAKGILQAMAYASETWPINLGSGKGYSVRDVVKTFKKYVDFKTVFDLDKPTGVPKRILDISKARKFNFNPSTSLFQGLKETWDWFMRNPDEYKLRQNYFTKKGE